MRTTPRDHSWTALLPAFLLLTLALACASPRRAGEGAHAASGPAVEALAHEIVTLQFDAPLSDLDAIGEAVGNARIVQLGEATHGDGTAFEIKARVVQYLHEKRGFDVLVFESGLYNCIRADEALDDPGRSAKDALETGVYKIWTAVEQLSPLWNYIKNTRDSQRPLRIAGMDCKFTGTGGAEDYCKFLFRFFERAEPGLLTEADRGEVLELCKMLEPTDFYENPGARDWRLGALMKMRESASRDRTKFTNPPAEANLALARQMLHNLELYRVWLDSVGRQSKESNIKNRDALMAENLLYVARVLHPGRKLIVWAHNYHIMNHIYLFETDADFEQADRRNPAGPAGFYLKRELGEDLYTIGFCAARGRHGLRGAARETLPAPPAGSLEDVFAGLPMPRFFLNLQKLPDGHWLGGFQTAGFYFYTPARTRWPRIYDGILFTRDMEPAR